MKGKTRGKWKRKGDTGKLQKYMISVDEFVQKKVGGGETEEDHGNRLVKNKSRKELRKEKRKLKKSKKKHYYEGNKHEFQMNSSTSKGNDNEITTTVKKDKNNKAKHDSKKTHKVTLNQSEMKNLKETGGQTAKSKKQPKEAAKKKKKNKLQENRKQALLEANAAEDKEIKKLERYLGLNKRKNKKTLPQSFAADGLDYILGALEPGLSASGMYESEEEMEVTDVKDKLKKLEGSDSELSDDADEHDDSADDVDENFDGDEDADEMEHITDDVDDAEETDEKDDEEDAGSEDDSAEASESEDEEDVGEELGEDPRKVADEKEDNASQTVFNMH